MAAKKGAKTPSKAKTKAAAKTAAKASAGSAKKPSVKKQPAKKQQPAAKTASKAKATANKAAGNKTTAKARPESKTAPRTKAAAGKAATRAKAKRKAPARPKAKAADATAAKATAKAVSKTSATRKKAPATSKAARTSTRKQSPAKQSRDSEQKSMKTRSRAASATPAKAAGAPLDSPFKNFTPYVPAKSEPYMSDQQLAHFRSILLKWRQDLMEEVDRTVHHMRDEAANFPDPADRATQEEEFSIELRTRDRERKLIRKIDQTIDRLDQDDFGFCDTCGVEIGLRRLEARPTATQCVDCKSLDEIKERQLHG